MPNIILRDARGNQVWEGVYITSDEAFEAYARRRGTSVESLKEAGVYSVAEVEPDYSVSSEEPVDDSDILDSALTGALVTEFISDFDSSGSLDPSGGSDFSGGGGDFGGGGADGSF